MTVIAVLEMTLKPETLADGLPVVHRILDETRAFEGCDGVEVMVDGVDPAHLVIIERWESPEADAGYRAFRAGPGKIDDLGPFLAGAPSLTKGELDPSV